MVFNKVAVSAILYCLLYKLIIIKCCKHKHFAKIFTDITSVLAKENLSHRTALAVYYLTGKKQ